MSSHAEQRSVIKFCVLSNKSPSETVHDLKKAYGSSSLSRSTIFMWHKRFAEGRSDIKDDVRSGRPQDVRTSRSIENVHYILSNEGRYTIREIGEDTSLSYGIVSRIIHNDLKMKKVSARWIPHILSDEQKENRTNASHAFLRQWQRRKWRFCHSR